MEKFEFTPIGYTQARQWLAQIGELEANHEKYFAMDGVQLITEANRIKENQIILNG